MIERWIGPDTMQRGVREYIASHAWKNAEAADLLGALDRASGRDVSGMAATFLDRPGVPNVAIAASCSGGASSPPAWKLSLGLTQSAWHPLGIEPKESDGAPWRIPVCVRAAGATKDECTELTQAQGALELAGDGACPAWTFPNAGGDGYYRASLPEASVRSLAHNQAQLDVASRIALVSGLWAQVRGGELAPDVFLGVLPAFDHETDSHVVAEIVRTLNAFDHALVDETTRPAFRAYVAARLASAKRRLGWEPKEGESPDDTLTRAQIFAAIGGLGHDPATLHEAERVAVRWLKDPASVDADVASIAVPLASVRAGLPRLGELRAAAAAAKTPLDRVTALSAMGTFEDKAALERALNLTLTDDVRQQDVRYVFAGALNRTERARLFFPWLATHWDAVRAKTPVGYEGDLVDVVAEACSKEDLDGELTYLTPRAKELEGAARPLAENAEVATACVALREHGAGSVAKFFKWR
jgi:aminopeptidase N